MVRWGAGVHQWQVTLGQLFNQLFVSVSSLLMSHSNHSVVGKHGASNLLSAQLPGQDGHINTVPPPFRSKPQCQQDNVVRRMANNRGHVRRLHYLHVLDDILLLA